MTPAAATVPPDVLETAHAHPCLTAIMHRLGLSLLVACFVPAALFYGVLQGLGITWAIVAALIWGYGALAWRAVTKRPVSGLLVLTVAVLTIRSVFTLSTGDTFVYFLQPLVTDTALAGLFLVSLLTARPVVARLASDFYPMSLEIAAHPVVIKLFWRLTLMWGCVCLARGAVGLWLLETLSTANFVLVKEVTFMVMTIVAVAVTVAASVVVLRRESMLAA